MTPRRLGASISLGMAIALSVACNKQNLPPVASDAAIGGDEPPPVASTGEAIAAGDETGGEVGDAAGANAALEESFAGMARLAEVTREPEYEQVPRRAITIDGDMSDWEGVRPLWLAATPSAPEVIDDSTSNEQPAAPEPAIEVTPTPASFLDLGPIWVAYDEDWIYLRFGIGRIDNLHALGGMLSLYMNVDGRPVTGKMVPPIGALPGLAGADVAIKFSPLRSSGRHEGWAGELLEANAPPTPLNPYQMDAMVAPVYASNEFEMRIRRGAELPTSTVNAFVDERLAFKFVAVNRDGAIVDQTPPFHIAVAARRMGEGQSHAASAAPRDLARPYDRHNRTARFVTWNVYRGNLFKDAEPFARVLQALNPDVICFQELGEDAREEDLREWLAVHVPYALGWELVMRRDLGVAIATKLTGLEVGPRGTILTDQGRRVKMISYLIASPGQRILVSNVHFTCCGGAGEERDLARIAEAEALHQIVRHIRYTDEPRSLVIMGDFNLVGSAMPLNSVVANNDVDGSDLLDVNPLVIDGMTNITWRDASQPFSPGRLDFALVSDAIFDVKQAFVLDTSILDEETLTANGLERDDTAAASDHLPLVVDLTWKAE